jgi:hypothetical protein
MRLSQIDNARKRKCVSERWRTATARCGNSLPTCFFEIRPNDCRRRSHATTLVFHELDHDPRSSAELLYGYRRPHFRHRKHPHATDVPGTPYKSDAAATRLACRLFNVGLIAVAFKDVMHDSRQSSR